MFYFTIFYQTVLSPTLLISVGTFFTSSYFRPFFHPSPLLLRRFLCLFLYLLSEFIQDSFCFIFCVLPLYIVISVQVVYSLITLSRVLQTNFLSFYFLLKRLYFFCNLDYQFPEQKQVFFTQYHTGVVPSTLT